MAEEPSEKQIEARDILPDESKPIFDDFVADYKYAATLRHGRPYISYIVLADMVRAGQRPSAEPISRLDMKDIKLPEHKTLKKVKYTKRQLWLIAFDIAYSIYFKVVDKDGNPVESRFKDFDYDSLTAEEIDLYDEMYCEAAEFCEEIYEKETGEKYE